MKKEIARDILEAAVDLLKVGGVVNNDEAMKLCQKVNRGIDRRQMAEYMRKNKHHIKHLDLG